MENLKLEIFESRFYYGDWKCPVTDLYLEGMIKCVGEVDDEEGYYWVSLHPSVDEMLTEENKYEIYRKYSSKFRD